MPKRVLIVANGFVNDAPQKLPAELLKFADPSSEMHVVVPEHLSRWQSLCSEVDQARADARTRLDRILQDMSARGLSATGQTGDENQLHAIEDALEGFDADAIVLVTHVSDQQNWREPQLIANAHRFGVPVQGALITREGTVAGPLNI